jgi:hypothetical protein
MSSSLPRLDALDGIRGLCSLWVVVGHLIEFWISNDGQGDFPVLALEYMSGVTLFFLISGFTLVVVYDRPGSDTATASSLLTTWEQKKNSSTNALLILRPYTTSGFLSVLHRCLLLDSISNSSCLRLECSVVDC